MTATLRRERNCIAVLLHPEIVSSAAPAASLHQTRKSEKDKFVGGSRAYKQTLAHLRNDLDKNLWSELDER